MAQWRDWAVQALIGEGLPPAFDDYDRGLELASVANLVEHRVAILCRSLGVSPQRLLRVAHSLYL
jgi:hypothetical protein